MTSILVTDGEQRSSLAAVRSLGAAGYRIEVCSSFERPLAGASRFCSAAHQVPDPATDPKGYAAAIADLVSKDPPWVLLPMTDVSAQLLLESRAALHDVVIPFPPMETYEAISDKRHLVETGPEIGVAVPRSMVLHSPNDDTRMVESFCAEVDYPVVLKPARSVISADAGLAKVAVTTAGSASDLVIRLDAYPPEAYPILLQEHIVGPGLGAFMLSDGGETIASFGHERIREKPPTGGVSVYRRSVPLREDVKEAAERVLRHFEWTGVAMVEFKEDRATGTPYLMEVNGRFWGSLQLAIDSGIDFPTLLVKLALGEPVQPTHTYALGVKSRWLWGEVDHLIGVLKSSRRIRSQNPDVPSRLGALVRFLVLWRPGDRWEILRASDPRPFARETLEWFRELRG